MQHITVLGKVTGALLIEEWVSVPAVLTKSTLHIDFATWGVEQGNGFAVLVLRAGRRVIPCPNGVQRRCKTSEKI